MNPYMPVDKQDADEIPSEKENEDEGTEDRTEI